MKLALWILSMVYAVIIMFALPDNFNKRPSKFIWIAMIVSSFAFILLLLTL